METSAKYVNHVNIVKELNFYKTHGESKNPNTQMFEEIYQKVKDEDVDLSNVKEFLTDLSQKELSTLGLHDSKDIDKLSTEGAYNLLMHNYETYDFDNDGTVEIGDVRTHPLVTQNMEDDVKKAWVETINSSGDDMMAIVVMSFSLDEERMKRMFAEALKSLSASERRELQKSASYDIESFITETLSKPYTPKELTFQDIQDEVDEIINQKGGRKSSAAMIQSTQNFWEKFQKFYNDIQTAKTQKHSTQEILDVKQQNSNSTTEIEESNLEKALKSKAS